MLSHLPYMVLRCRFSGFVALAALADLADLVDLLVADFAAFADLAALAFFFCSKANLIPASNKADISGVRLTPPVFLDDGLRFIVPEDIFAILFYYNYNNLIYYNRYLKTI